MPATHITKDKFQKDVLEAQNVVFVDFYADWCGPCKLTGPIIDELSDMEEYKNKVTFVKINVDENQELAARYSVFSIPTFILFKGGKPVHQFIGALSRTGFIKEIGKTLS